MKYIYAYRDPFDLKIKYIGQTVNLAHRLIAHYAKKENNRELSTWLHDLRRNGAAPIVETLETVEDSEARLKEYDWITYGLSLEWPLFNVAVYKPTGKYKSFKIVPYKYDPVKELNKIMRARGL
jgi:hypothetical protein